MGSGSGDTFSRYGVRELSGGHKKKVLTVGWNSNGKRLATGSDDGVIKIWRVDPRHVSKPERFESELTGHTDSVIYIRWDPVNPERLASLSSDKSVRLWDAKSSRNLGTLKAAAGLLHLSWKPDGSELAWIDRTDTISVVDTRSIKVVRTHKCTSEANEMIWSHDGKLCYVATAAGAIEVLEYPTFQKVRSFTGHVGSVYHLCLDPSNRYLASGGTDACISLWDTSDMVCVKTLVTMDNEVNNMSFSPNSKYLAYLDHKLGICIADVASGQVVHVISTNGHIPDALDWNTKHMTLAWPGAFTQDFRDASRDSGSVLIFAPS